MDPQCKGPCLPHCYANKFLFLIVGIIIGILFIKNYNRKVIK